MGESVKSLSVGGKAGAGSSKQNSGMDRTLDSAFANRLIGPALNTCVCDSKVAT